MKTFIAVFATLILLLLGTEGFANTPQSSLVSCKYKAADIGQVIGYGENIHQARSAASEKCFDRRVSLMDQRGPSSDDEQGLMLIDSCVNIECG